MVSQPVSQQSSQLDMANDRQLVLLCRALSYFLSAKCWAKVLWPFDSSHLIRPCAAGVYITGNLTADLRNWWVSRKVFKVMCAKFRTCCLCFRLYRPVRN